MESDDKYVAIIALAPFLMGAVYHFCPAWFWIPMAMFLGVLWFGCWIKLGEKK